MPKSEAQLRQISTLPITWLSDGFLKTSILLRQEATEAGKTSEALRYLFREKSYSSNALDSFPRLNRPDSQVMQRASDEYMRCVLAKGIAEVYRKVTPKYRNEAARRQFFKKMTDVAEAVHLAPTNDRLRDLLSSHQRDDDAMTWLGVEVEALTEQKVNLASEYNSKLSSARVEFAAVLRQLESLVGITWSESDRFRPSLRICSFFPPGVHEDENTWRWGSQWYPEEGVLNLNPPILFIDPIRKGVVAREAAILLSPRNLDTIGHQGLELCEQAEYFAYRLFERKNDREFWSEARHGLRQKTRFRAHELIDFFHFYEMMVGDSLYREVWSRLKEFGDTKLTFSDYLTIFSSLASRPTNPRYDKKEVQLFDLLCKRPNVGAGEAARLLGVSIPTAMKAIAELSKKAGLSFTVLVDIQRIGLIENLVALRTSKPTNVVGILSRFPYCRQVFRTYGSFDLFSVWDIPKESNEFAREFLNRMVDKQLITSFTLLQLQRDLQATNIGGYDVKEHRWDIHWDAWGLGLRESLAGGGKQLSEIPTQKEVFQLDKLDLNILSSLQINCRTPFSAIGRTLNMSGAYIGRRVTKMERQGLFRYAIWPMKIGAEDWGLLGISCSSDVANTLAQNLSRLPAWRGGFVNGDFEGLLAIVWCPNGELKQFFKAIDDRLIKTGLAKGECLNSIGDWTIARWLPVDPDDPWKLYTEDSKWVFDEDHYMALLEQ